MHSSPWKSSYSAEIGYGLFNDALNTFYLYGVRHMVKDHSDSERRLAARVLLYASPHRQDNTYDDLCYTSRGALAGTKNTCAEICKLSTFLWTALDETQPLKNKKQKTKTTNNNQKQRKTNKVLVTLVCNLCMYNCNLKLYKSLTLKNSMNITQWPIFFLLQNSKFLRST